MEFKSKFKVYYEDTDSGGVVYYANYLKFLERARTDAITSLNFSNRNLIEEFGIYIIVKSCNLNFHKPAKLEDNLNIISKVLEVKNVSIRMKQYIFVNDSMIVEAEILLASVDEKGKPSKLPAEFKSQLIK
ncbi:YbgC/FadM family acyl-CoA thioesterase [Candidatus Pelagibacter sp.]|nr:YbgC/FadM family acyl-CoA thioesterase [Candidatus Pelagibacter sp.]